MQSSYKAIGVLGGTFDPIHVGHLRMGIEIYETLKLDKIHLIPCYHPVHRDPPIASPEQRLAMTEHAIQHETEFYADVREIQRKKPSYMIETLEELRSEMPNTSISLIIGLDAFLEFDTWHRFAEILNNAHLIIAYRPSFRPPSSGILKEMLTQHLQQDLTYIHQHTAGSILLLPIPALEISASAIRKLIAMGKNTRYLLPDNVYGYIQQHGIYKK